MLRQPPTVDQHLPPVARSVLGRSPAEQPAAGGTLVHGCRGDGGPKRGRQGEGRPEEDENFEETRLQNQGYLALDGCDDENAHQTRRGKGGKGFVKVADRVRAFEERSQKPGGGGVHASHPRSQRWKSKFAVNGADAANQSAASNVPLVFPLHVRRFVRRTSKGSPLRPETPLYRSEPDEDPVIHAPLPRRSIPSIPTPVDTSLADDETSTTQVVIAPSTNTAAEGLDRPYLAPKPRISPVAHFHGTRGHCVRHGRKSGHRKNKHLPSSTREIMEKGRNGAYAPMGLLQRRQMDATSPWLVRHRVKDLTETEDCDSKPITQEACPDCVGELGIRKREMMQAADGSAVTVMRPSEGGNHDDLPLVDSVGEIPAATIDQYNSPTSAYPSTSMGSHHVASKNRQSSRQCVKTFDLGETLDAVILERGGHLEYLVTNARHGSPTFDTMARLSRELTQASQAVATAAANTSSRSTVEPAESMTSGMSLVLGAHSDRSNVEQLSVAELLRLIDHAVSAMTSSLTNTTHCDSAEYMAHHEDHSATNENLVNNHVTTQHHHHLDQDYHALKEVFGGDSSRETVDEIISRCHHNSNSNSNNYPRSEPRNLQLPLPIAPNFHPTTTIRAPRLPSELLRASDVFHTSLPPAEPRPEPLYPVADPSEQIRNANYEQTQIIRHAMRMERGKAVQEAATMERRARRARQWCVQARKALA